MASNATQSQEPTPAQLSLRSIIDCAHEASRISLNSHARIKETTASPVQGYGGDVFGHWCGVIVVACEPARIIYKAHFMSQTAKALAGVKVGRTPENIPADLAADFMREFCNMSAGAIKRALSNEASQAGISLPVVTRGFDEVFQQYEHDPNSLHFYWTLGTPQGELVVTLNIVIADWVGLAKLKLNPIEQPDDQEGEMEFL